MLRRCFLRRMTVLNMPALSPTMEKGTITEWARNVGDLVKSDELIAKVQTDKAVVDWNHVGDDFFLARVLAEAGQKVTVGEPAALAVEEKEELESSEVKNYKVPSAAPAAAPAESKKPEDSSSSKKSSSSSAPEPKSSSAGGNGGRVFASPLARNIAQELGIDLSLVTGTGGGVGRITKDDVVFAAKSGVGKAAPAAADGKKKAAAASAVSSSAGAAFEDIAVSPMRGVIAERLLESKTDIPHYYLMQEYRADNMLKLIKHLNAKADGKYKISVNDFIIKCVARANLLAPECNTHWHGEFMRKYSGVDVSMAVATPSGLITPIIRNAHVKGLSQISQETKALAKRARDGDLKPEEYQGGTISVSNLGAMGVDRFTAIINPPQSTILAVGQTRPRPAFTKNDDGTFSGTGAVETVVSFSASFDHRVVDGAVGAKWFKHFGESFENPLSLLL